MMRSRYFGVFSKSYLVRKGKAELDLFAMVAMLAKSLAAQSGIDSIENVPCPRRRRRILCAAQGRGEL